MCSNSNCTISFAFRLIPLEKVWTFFIPTRDELISDVLLWTPTHGRAKAGRPARTYIQQLCEDMGCCPEDLPEAMNDREKCRERIRDIRATSTTWWWWWWWWWDKCYYYHSSIRKLFVTAPHLQTGLDTRSKARRPIKVGRKGRGRSGTSRDSNSAGLRCWSTH